MRTYLWQRNKQKREENGQMKESEAMLKNVETHGRKEIKLEINDILRGSKLAYSG